MDSNFKGQVIQNPLVRR